jgi:hypothetical protein
LFSFGLWFFLGVITINEAYFREGETKW